MGAIICGIILGLIIAYVWHKNSDRNDENFDDVFSEQKKFIDKKPIEVL